METRKLFVPHSECQTTDLWPLPWSPWWHQAGLLFVGGEDEPCQQTFSHVSGFCFSSSLFSFMAVIPKKQDGENKRSAQHIYPWFFISTIIALRASYNPSINKFPSWQISYLLQRAEFSEIPLLLAAALKRLDNILTLQAIQHIGGRELLSWLNWYLASLEGRLNKQSWVTLWRIPWQW